MTPFKNLRLNAEGQLAQGEWCLTPRSGKVTADHCVKGTVNGPWLYDEVAYFFRLHNYIFRLLFFPILAFLKIFKVIS